MKSIKHGSGNNPSAIALFCASIVVIVEEVVGIARVLLLFRCWGLLWWLHDCLLRWFWLFLEDRLTVVEEIKRVLLKLHGRCLGGRLGWSWLLDHCFVKGKVIGVVFALLQSLWLGRFRVFGKVLAFEHHLFGLMGLLLSLKHLP